MVYEEYHLLILVLLSGQLVYAQDLFCIDPDTNLRYPINSTWTASTFCGKFHCTELKINKDGSLYPKTVRDEPHSVYFDFAYDSVNKFPDNGDVEEIGSDYKEHKQEEESPADKENYNSKHGQRPIKVEPYKIKPEYEENRGQNHHPKTSSAGLNNIDLNFKEFERENAPHDDSADYETILDEYYEHFANRQQKPIKEMLKEKLLRDQEIDSRSSGSHPSETMSKIVDEGNSQVNEQLIEDTQINGNNDNDVLLYYDYIKKTYTPEKPENFDIYEKFYQDYLANKTDIQNDPSENNYNVDNTPPDSEEQPENQHISPEKPIEIEERQLPEYNTDDMTVLGGWTYNYPDSENNFPDMLNHRAIKELSEELGVKENTLKLAMVMEDQGLPNSDTVPTVKYTLDSDSESEEIEKQDTDSTTDDGEESFIDLARNLIRSLSPVSLPLDRSRLSRNQRSSRLSKLNPRIRERLLGRSRFGRSVTYADDISLKESESIPYITVTGCPESTTPGYYTSDPSKPFPQCCPQLIRYQK